MSASPDVRSGSSARRRPSRSSRTRTSARCMTSGARVNRVPGDGAARGETLLDDLRRGATPEQTLRYGVEIADALTRRTARDRAPGPDLQRDDQKSGVKILASVWPRRWHRRCRKTSDRIADAGEPDSGRDDPRDVPIHAPSSSKGRTPTRELTSSRLVACSTRWRSGKKSFFRSTQASLIGAISHSDPASISSIQPSRRLLSIGS